MQSFLPLNKKFEILHISQLLSGMDLTLKDADMKLIYHDSSVLGRKLGIYEAPRKLLEMAGGFIEFEQHEELAQCCGGDLAFSAAFPDMAGKMAERIVEEAREKNATIVTASPHCYHQLKKYGNVIDIVELLDRCL
jgi:Fe-S oxidoreductase